MKMEKLVLVSLAGIQAQRRYRPSSIRSWHAQADYHSAINMLSYFAPNAAELTAYFKLLRIRVDLLFDVPYKWAQVEALAAALLERHTLSAEEAVDVIRGTLPRMRPDLFDPAQVPE